MFIPDAATLCNVLQIDGSQWLCPGKRIEGKNGNAAAKKFLYRTLEDLSTGFHEGTLRRTKADKILSALEKKFGSEVGVLTQKINRVRETDDWRLLCLVSQMLENGEIAAGLLLHHRNRNARLLSIFRRLEFLSIYLRKHLFFNSEKSWNMRNIIAPQAILKSRTLKKFNTPEAFEVWKGTPKFTLHPCEFIALGYFIQHATQQR